MESNWRYNVNEYGMADSQVLLASRVLVPWTNQTWFGVWLVAGQRRYVAWDVNIDNSGRITFGNISTFNQPPLPWSTMVAIGWVEPD